MKWLFLPSVPSGALASLFAPRLCPGMSRRLLYTFSPLLGVRHTLVSLAEVAENYFSVNPRLSLPERLFSRPWFWELSATFIAGLMDRIWSELAHLHRTLMCYRVGPPGELLLLCGKAYLLSSNDSCFVSHAPARHPSQSWWNMWWNKTSALSGPDKAHPAKIYALVPGRAFQFRSDESFLCPDLATKVSPCFPSC